MSKFKKILFTLALTLGIILLLDFPSEAAAVKNNGGDVVQKGNYVYYVTQTQSSYKLYRISTENKNKKLLDSASTGISDIHISGDFVFYQKGDSIYKTPLNKKSPKKVVTGELMSIYNKKIFYTAATSDTNYKDSLYKIGTNGKNKKRIFQGNLIYKSGVNGKNLILCNSLETKVKLMLVNMQENTSKVITTNKQQDSYATYPVVPQAYMKNSIIYYTVGTYQGSGHFFYGDFFKVGTNGKNRKKIASATSEAFYVYDGNIFYCDSEYENWKRYNIKSGKKTSVSQKGTIENGYVYYMEKKNAKINVYRFPVNKTKKAATKFATFNCNSSYEYHIQDITKVGSYIYIEFSAISYEGGGGWRGTWMGNTLYKMTTKGKNIKKIS